MSSETSDEARASSQAAEFARRLARGFAAFTDAGEVTIGNTPKDAVFTEDKVVLYRYRPADDVPAPARLRTPVLICYALVNRPYMMDLQADRSLIRGLLQRGLDVYLIDWGYPDGADRYLDLEDYVLRYLAHCVDFVRDATGHERINLLGVCQGGTLSLCYAALHPRALRNLITMVTPVDFRTPENLLTKWAEHIDLEALAASGGNVPGTLLNGLFLSLMPFRLTSHKYIDLFERLGGSLEDVSDPSRIDEGRRALQNFMRMEQWIFDSPDQAGEMFRQFITSFVRENRLAAGTLEIAGRPVDLRRIDVPVLNIYALQDHLVPPSASRPLQHLLGTTDYSAHEFPGGHIGIYVSGAAQREIPDCIARWLRTRDRVDDASNTRALCRS